MAVNFPPTPRYPEALDDDTTLFKVYNTSEARISEENLAWSQTINIAPVGVDKDEIWADNGFATLDGELLYYNEVEKNVFGKVTKLLKCVRNLGGRETHYNKPGTWIRGFVVAEHHNQIVDAILKTQNFIGFNFDPRIETLDWRIRNLQDLPIIFDDYNCPDINFTFNIIETTNEQGILASYAIVINGSVNSFRLDFGDGDFTTTSLTGTHRYALNANIDPVVTVTNGKCQVAQTAIERINPTEPPSIVDIPFEIPIPELPAFPDFTLVPCEIGDPVIFQPPIITPCVSIEGQIGPIPSFIETDVPTSISIEGLNFPSEISVVGCDFPSTVFVDFPEFPASIVICNPIPSTIVIEPPASNLTLDLNIDSLPMLQVDWGEAPQMEVKLAMATQPKMIQGLDVDPELMMAFGDEYSDVFNEMNKVRVEYEPVGIPSEIKVIPPKEMPKIEISTPDIPDIKIIHDIPREIEVIGTGIPDIITLEHDLPESITLNVLGEIPKEIFINATSLPTEISLVGFKDTIELIIPENLGIPLILPEKMPDIQMVYSGPPIELKLNIDNLPNVENNEDLPCVMLVPCSRKNG